MIRVKQRRRQMAVQALESRWMFAGGPYAPAAGVEGSTAIDRSSSAIVGWATAYENYIPGANVDAVWQAPELALGPAVGDNFDIVSLGDGGAITLKFAAPIRDGLGADFAVFENAITDTFLELAFVEVSSNGVDFFRFPSDSLTAALVGAFGEVDPTNVDGLAGKYRQGFGTPFDLAALAGASPLLNVNRVTHVRIVDIVGDGSSLDSSGDPIYDPHPTSGSAGFDLEAVAVLKSVIYETQTVGFEDVGNNLASEDHWNGPDPNGQQQPGGFGDTIVAGKFTSGQVDFNNIYSLDYDSWSGWAYSNRTDTATGDFSNQFSALAGGGAGDSPTYAVAFYDLFGVYPPPTMTLTAPVQDRFVHSIQVTNTTYAGLSMRDGDSFAKKFGGASGNDPDWFLLTIQGKTLGGESAGEVEFYLADYRFADNSQDYIVDDWTEVDLSALRGAVSFEFSLSSSDVGPFGMNTPAYVAIDNVLLARERLPIEIGVASISEDAGPNAAVGTVGRNDDDLSQPLTVFLTSSDTSEARVPSSVIIPAGAASVEFPIEAIDDDLLDGVQTVHIRASASGYALGTASLAVTDTEAALLSISLSASSVAETAGAGGVIGTVFRNDGNLSQPLVVSLASSDASEAVVPSTLTIAAGQSDATFPIDAIDDLLFDGEQVVTITASALGYTGGEAQLTVTDNESRKLTLTVDPDRISEVDAPPTGRFEDVGLALGEESFWNGSNGSGGSGGFATDGLDFANDYNAEWGVWSGWAYSNVTDTVTGGFGNQYSAYAIGANDDGGGGALGSATYGVAYAYPGGFPATIDLNASTAGLSFRSLAITNTTYAALTMLEGDPFSKKFGGASGDDPDWFLLSIEGRDAGGASIGVVEFYLADYRFADNSLDYVIEDWSEVDVSSLEGASQLAFSLSSSDVGAFGMNTPAYFAVDNIVLGGSEVAPAAVGVVSRNDEDLSEPLEVQIDVGDPRQAMAPRVVTIPAGQVSVEFPIDAFDDNLLDGEQTTPITISADGYDGDAQDLTVEDHENLTVTINVASAPENAGNSFAIGKVTRGNSDRSAPLVVSLASSNVNVASAPTTVTIPAGAASAEFAIEIPNDMLLDGDQTAVFTAEAPGYVGIAATLTIVDNDRVGHNVDRPTDVDADGETTNQDVMILLSVIRDTSGGGKLFDLGIDWESLAHFPDVNDDGYVSNIDVFLTISAARENRALKLASAAGKVASQASTAPRQVDEVIADGPSLVAANQVALMQIASEIEEDKRRRLGRHAR